LPRHGYCRICEYWTKFPYKVSEKELFNKKCREGTSLRKLELLLEAYGLKARKDLISKHIRLCMSLEVREQRGIERELSKEKGLRGLGRKISGIFVRPEEPKLPQKCPHTSTYILLCNKCMEEWSNWKDEKGFRYNWDRIRKIREAWYEGEDLP